MEAQTPIGFMIINRNRGLKLLRNPKKKATNAGELEFAKG